MRQSHIAVASVLLLLGACSFGGKSQTASTSANPPSAAQPATDNTVPVIVDGQPVVHGCIGSNCEAPGEIDVVAAATPPAATVVVQPTPTYFTDYYYKAPYYKTTPSQAEAAAILTNAGYTNPTDLKLSGETWSGKATVADGHQVNVSFDRQGIWQTTR